MTLQFRPPFQIDPNAETPQERSLARLNQTLMTIGQNSSQNRRADAMLAMQKAQEQRAAQAHYAQYGDPNWSPDQMTPQGPQPSGATQWGSGTQGPQPQGTLTDQFMNWRQRSKASPMDMYAQMLSDPRAGSVRASAYLTGQKEALGLEKEQSEIEKNRAMAGMYARGGAGAGKGQWKLNQFTGEYDFFPNSGPGMMPPATPPPAGGGAPTPGGVPRPRLPFKDQAKLDKEKPKASGSLQNTLREYDNMINEATAIQNDPSLAYATGFLAPVGKVPGTGAKRVAARLDTLKAKTLLNVLASLKDLSASGASGFGALSNIEGENIRNSISSLDASQSTADMKNSIARFVGEMKKRKQVLQNTFNETYGEMPGGNMSGAGMPGGGGGKIKVSNGSETLWIDASDAEEAAQDGYLAAQ